MGNGKAVAGKLIWSAEKDCWIEETEKTQAEAAKAERKARKMDRAHLDALAADFIISRYIPGSSPRTFRSDEGYTYDAGEFTILCADLFEWTGRAATWYRRLDQVLIEAGFRLREETSRRTDQGTGTGFASVPVALEGIHSF